MQLFNYFALLAGSEARLLIYFLIGGITTMLTIYLASIGRGTTAAFIATLPIQTAFTFMLIYAEGGKDIVVDYASGLIIFALPWLCYVATVILGIERLGIYNSLGLGVIIYIVLSRILQELILGSKP